MVLSCARAGGARTTSEVANRTASPAAGASLCIFGDIRLFPPRIWRRFWHQLSIDSALEPHLCKGRRPAHSREKTSLDSPPVLVYGFAAGGTRPFAGPANLTRRAR